MRTERAKRSVIVGELKTSVCVEEPFWQGLREMARDKGMTIQELLLEISQKNEGVGLTPAIRLTVFNYFYER